MAEFEFSLEPLDNKRLANLCGQFDEHLRQIEGRLGIQISNRGERFHLGGSEAAIATGEELIQQLYAATASETLSPEAIHLYLQEAQLEQIKAHKPATAGIRTRKSTIQPRGERQIQYVEAVRTLDLTFGIGPAGTGKTFLAVACAVEALEAGSVQRLVLVRPAVEAGERLGFLPGDMMQKVDPYLRPIYDALYEFLGVERVSKLVEKNVIEIAPLAFMRGRTLNHSYVIMDEAQNTTVEQMKMFLTRIGFGSRAVVTGDVTQVDLPRSTRSGLADARQVLAKVEGVAFCQFTAADVVRHPLVQRIVEAYDRVSESENGER